MEVGRLLRARSLIVADHPKTAQVVLIPLVDNQRVVFVIVLLHLKPVGDGV
jgi:hypothetical protein